MNYGQNLEHTATSAKRFLFTRSRHDKNVSPFILTQWQNKGKKTLLQLAEERKTIEKQAAYSYLMVAAGKVPAMLACTKTSKEIAFALLKSGR